jgi:TctA family transporter
VEESLVLKFIEALVIIADPVRMMFLITGVLMGLVLGVIPGLGGIVGLAILLPFTFEMDPYSAFAILLGIGAVTSTSDTIPAVLFGVPGTAGTAATILDGYPLAKKGQAGRALGASYTANLMGGLFGAALLAFSIPILRPVMLYIGSPELLSFTIFGLTMVAVLSGSSPLRGLLAASFGLMISMIGTADQTGSERWTLDSLYLWEGLPIVPVTLGIFALPELADLAIARRTIAGKSKIDARSGQLEGFKDAIRHWWLVVRVSWIGAGLGAIPGIGGSVVDWIAYGHAARSEKGADETFGHGDIRGVIASEGSNNAKDGGALVPTIAFGVPGSAGMAILLGVFMIHGLQPGPDMLTKDITVTYSMVWSIAIANVFGTAICFAFAGHFAKLAMVRYSVIMPIILSVVLIGAYQGTRSWGDLLALLFFGVLGWIMKRLQWPRPPIILGFVLGSIVERYMFISIGAYGASWLLNPVVFIMLAMSAFGLARPFMREVTRVGGLRSMVPDFSRSQISVNTAFYIAFLTMVTLALMETYTWPYGARLIPQIVCYFALVVGAMSFLNYTFRPPVADIPTDAEDDFSAQAKVMKALHMDLVNDDDDIDKATIAKRAVTYLGWILFFYASTFVIGMLPTMFFFVIAYMRYEGRERWSLVFPWAGGLPIFCYIVFDQLIAVPWPHSLLGDWYPILRDVVPSM